jgi:hypothetical protein
MDQAGMIWETRVDQHDLKPCSRTAATVVVPTVRSFSPFPRRAALSISAATLRRFTCKEKCLGRLLDIDGRRKFSTCHRNAVHYGLGASLQVVKGTVPHLHGHTHASILSWSSRESYPTHEGRERRTLGMSRCLKAGAEWTL